MLASFIQRELGIPTTPETHFFDMAFKRTGRLDMQGLPAETRANTSLVKAYEALKDPQRDIACFRALLTNILGSHPVIAEKTPDHLTALEEILQSDKRTLAVVMVRRCDDVCASLNRVAWNRRSWRTNGSYWRARYLITRDLKRRFPARVVALNYESFCKNPTRGADAIRKRLPSYQPRWIKADLFDPDLATWKAGADEPPRARPRRRSDLSLRARATLWAIDRITRMTAPISFDG